MCLVNHPAPEFELEGYFKGDFKKYKLSDCRGKWVILLFYPLDVTVTTATPSPGLILRCTSRA